MAELNIEARTENLEKVLAFIGEILDEYNCSLKVRTQLDIAVEELFVNIAHYAYHSGAGAATVRVETEDAPRGLTLTFMDRGAPFDPLSNRRPDTTSLPARERPIGGLGLFMVRKIVDEIAYRREDGMNILTVRKKF